MIRLPVEVTPLDFDTPQEVKTYSEALDRVEARGIGFSEMQSYWALPFHDFSIVGDVCTIKDKHNRQLYDSIHVATVNPVWIYSMKPLNTKLTRLSLNHIFDRSGGGGNWRSRALPRIKMTPLGGTFATVLAVHDEVSNTLVLVEPNAGSTINVHMRNTEWLAPVKDVARKMGIGARATKSPDQPYFRMLTDFAQDNKLLFFSPKQNIVQLLDLSSEVPTCHRLELPFKIGNLRPLNENQYLISTEEEGKNEPNLYLLRKESSDEALPSHLNPVAQNVDDDSLGKIVSAGKEGLSDLGLRYFFPLGLKVIRSVL